MTETAIRLGLRGLAPAALFFVASLTATQAQQPLPGAGSPQRNPMCVRLESQLATVDRGHVDPARAEQIKRYEDTANRQQAELDRLSAQARRLGCEGRGFFSLFGGQPQQCAPINHQIQQMRANLDKVLNDLQRLQGNSADREGERRAILVSLAQNDCGPQYRAAANRSAPGFFESLFGGFGNNNAPGMPPTSSGSGDTYRTICVRTCDGFYFPVSYSTTPSRFHDDEQVCQRMCPASETALYSHRNPGEDVSQAISSAGRYYSELPTAFAYRKAFNASCSCKAPGQTWADALGHLDDQTLERGDIVVTEEQAKILSQPLDARGKPTAARPKGPMPTPEPTPAVTPAAAPTPNGEPGKRQVRTVGPTFLPSN
jgi:Protein of unknown function (DUF2865)